jgi:hypothetical protein
MDKVQFLYDAKNDEVFAYFPEIDGDNKGNKTCYAHIGQHSACSPEYVKECKRATKEQYQPLMKELEEIGYNLQVID